MPDAVRTLVILTAYDPDVPGERTLYFTHGDGFTTKPSETPANVVFEAALDEPLNIRRRLQGLGRVSPSLGEIRIANADGAYDDLTGYTFDGRAITVRQGPWTGDYPTDYPVVFTGTVDRVDVTRDYLLVRVRDGVAALQEPLQTVAYDGDNVPPDGLEGEADLEGATKPLAFGRVRNVPLTLVNAQKLIYQVSDSECDVTAVYDNGIDLSLTVYGSAAVAHGVTDFGGRALCEIGGTLIIGGFSGASTPIVLTTTNGTSFTDVTPVFLADESCEALASNGSRVVGVGLRRAGSADPHIFTSDNNGATWTERSLPASWVGAVSAMTSVRWHDEQGVFVITGNGGRIATSTDGITWTARTSGVSVTLYDSASDETRIVVVGNDGGSGTAAFRVSTDDGVTWGAVTTGITPTANVGFLSIRRLGSRWVLLTSSEGGGIYSTEDFTNWSQRQGPRTAFGATAYFDAYPDPNTSQWILGGSWVVATSQTGTEFSGVPAINASNQFGVFDTVNFASRYWFAGDPHGLAATAAPISYADLTELEDDAEAPVAGSYGVASTSSGTYVRLGSSPAGLVTADVTEGATAADRTAGQLFVRVLERAGYTSGDWSASDITALDTADDGVCGIYLETGGNDTVAEVLDAIAQSVGAWWTVDALGVFRIQQLTAPSGTNLIARSEEFDTWTNLSADVTANAITAPDGTTTADRITVNGGTTTARRMRAVTFTGTGTKNVSVFLKEYSTSRPTGVAILAGGVTVLRRVRVTWTAGVPSLSNVTGSGALGTPEDVGNGWWRVSFTATGFVPSGDDWVAIYPWDTADGTDDNSGVYAWGAQAENAAEASAYTRTGATAVTGDASTFTITADDIKGRLDRVTGSDPLRGLPSYRTTLRYARNYAVQTDGVAGAVSPARRLELSREWREVVATDTGVQTAHLLAQATVEDTLYASQADAQAEATRRQTLRGTQRSAFVVRVPSVDYGGVALGAVGTLQHPRFGLSAGVLVKVLGVEPDARDRSVTLTLWK